MAGAYARRLAGPYEDPDDVAQDAAIRVLGAPDRASPRDCAYWAVKEARRVSFRQPVVVRSLTGQTSGEERFGEDDPSLDQDDRVRTVLKQLRPDWRESLEQTVMADRPVAEYARRIGRHHKTIEDRVRRAKRAFEAAWIRMEHPISR